MDEKPVTPSDLPADPLVLHPLQIVRLLRSAGSALLAQAALHGRLAGVEWEEEKQRLLNLLIALLLGFAFLLCLLLLTGALVLALSWGTVYRTPAIIALALLYGAGITLASLRVRALSGSGSQSFAATREELAADIALLRSKL